MSPYYTINIADPEVGLTGIVETTRVIDPDNERGYSLVYLPKYVNSDNPILDAPDEEIFDRFMAGFRRIFPDFDPQTDLIAHKVMRARLAEPVHGVGAGAGVPGHLRSRIPGPGLRLDGAHLPHGGERAGDHRPRRPRARGHPAGHRRLRRRPRRRHGAQPRLSRPSSPLRPASRRRSGRLSRSSYAAIRLCTETSQLRASSTRRRPISPIRSRCPGSSSSCDRGARTPPRRWPARRARPRRRETRVSRSGRRRPSGGPSPCTPRPCSSCETSLSGFLRVGRDADVGRGEIGAASCGRRRPAGELHAVVEAELAR